LGALDFGAGFVTEARLRSDFGIVAFAMKIGGGLLHADLLLGEAEIDFALLAFHGADDSFLGRFKASLFAIEAGAGEIEAILIGGDAGVGLGLFERGLRLIESNLLFAGSCWVLAGSKRMTVWPALSSEPGGASQTI